MINLEIKRLEREATARLNIEVKRLRASLTYRQMRRIYAYRLANAETRRLIRAEAQRRGYQAETFAP